MDLLPRRSKTFNGIKSTDDSSIRLTISWNPSVTYMPDGKVAENHARVAMESSAGPVTRNNEGRILISDGAEILFSDIDAEAIRMIIEH